GGFGPVTASFSVVFRSVNDFAVRLIVTFGYFLWNSLLSCSTTGAWPPRTSWSHTVSVTGPRAANGLAGAAAVEPPSVAPYAAAAAPLRATAASGAARRHERLFIESPPGPLVAGWCRAARARRVPPLARVPPARTRHPGRSP